MSKKRIIFMGTPEISALYLKTLIDFQYNIIAVFTQPARKKGRGMKFQISPVQKLAEEKGIKVFAPIELDSSDINNQFENLKPDLIVVMGYGLILPKYILSSPTFGCINIHVSLLPKWRGAAPIEHAILNGDKKTGISIIKLVDKLDAGPILEKRVVPIGDNINKGHLTSLLNKTGTNMLIEIIPKIFQNSIIPEIQNEEEASYASKISAEMRKLDFNKNVFEIYNKIRAFSPNPLAWFLFNNERIRVVEANYKEGNFEPSIIINDQFHISCKNGIICPTIIQREGKNAIDLKAFLRGYKFTIGSKVNA